MFRSILFYFSKAMFHSYLLYRSGQDPNVFRLIKGGLKAINYPESLQFLTIPTS